MKIQMTAALLCALSSTFAFAAPAQFDALVTPTPNGEHQFSKITQALQAAKNSNKENYVIYIKNGVYNEKFDVNVDHVTLEGESEDKTIVQYDAASGMTNPQGQHWGTSKSFVIRIKANDVTLKNLTVKNSFDYPANDVKTKDDPTRINSSQAVALSVGNGAERAKILNVTLDGYQDTLLVRHDSTSYFNHCTVKGNVDFIFGGGVAVFDQCNIVARARTRPMTTMGFITAPSTDINQPYGLVFINSRITKEANVPADSFGLGRPWHPSRTFADGRYADPNAKGSTIYYHCYLDDHLYGWDKMSGWDKDKQRIWFNPDTDARFYEYGSTGPAANKAGKQHILSDKAAKQLTIEHVLGGTWYHS
ncbi:pectinesterase family protein [Vibrio nitrifigilis]|uniref:Pectinesterase n=1 Tax=Vibrio nitrifigilis TaxID=2789781 RepID=A0ABS0GIX6_9VIBR|nr:pectinesterase family protein [Vibrio nitrifigilis]MBF9002385.1 pectinesterase A [Vibrio nitrifigilis]